MNVVEVIYFSGCPNALKVTEALKREGIGFREVIQDELEPSDPKRSYSSPSIIVDGLSVLGTKSDGAGSCTYESIDSEDVVLKVRTAIQKRGSDL